MPLLLALLLKTALAIPGGRADDTDPRPVVLRAGTILTVSDTIRDPELVKEARKNGGEAWYRLPEDELIARIDRTIGAALKAAAQLGAR